MQKFVTCILLYYTHLQTRFFLDREAVDEDNPVWTVPINYYNADPENDFTDTRANYWLTAAEDTTDIDLADDEWFILNKQGIGSLSS